MARLRTQHAAAHAVAWEGQAEARAHLQQAQHSHTQMQQQIKQQQQTGWDVAVSKAKASLGKLAKMSLSAFAEDRSGEPLALQGTASPTCSSLQSSAAPAVAHVDRGMAVARPPGVASHLLAGNPKRGGMGTLPWQIHITSHHVVGARTLIVALTRPPATTAALTEPP